MRPAAGPRAIFLPGPPPASVRALLVVLAILLVAPAHALDRINLLFIGQVVPEACPLPFWFESEPAATFTLVPTKTHWNMRWDEARRWIRLYFPRTRELTWQYDFFMFINPYFDPFTGTQIEHMRSAIMEGGSGGFQTLGGMTIDSADPNFAWLQSSLAPIFPNDPSEVELWRRGTSNLKAYTVMLEKDSGLPPVLTPFLEVGIEQVPGSNYVVPLAPQEGATVWARVIGAFAELSGPPLPWLLSWRAGMGMTWSVADDLDVPWWSGIYSPSEQEYGLDILMNIVLHSLGRSTVQDVIVVNAVRRDFRAYSERVSTIDSFIDFVEKFGASSDHITAARLGIDGTMEQAMEHYMEGRYDRALEAAEEAHRSLTELERKTMKLKDQALLWVYLTEWAAVSGTGMLAGYAVFALMVRRKLYRQVRATRLRSDRDTT